jgi:hypothetical protein
MSRYKTLRTWSLILVMLGVVSMVAASIGVVSWAFAVEGLWDTLAVIFFGAPVAVLLAAWPLAVGQALRALADIGDALTFDPVPVVNPPL